MNLIAHLKAENGNFKNDNVTIFVTCEKIDNKRNTKLTASNH